MQQSVTRTLSPELLAKLRIGDRPPTESEANDRWAKQRNAVYLETAIALGMAWRTRRGWNYDRNGLLNYLDRYYPGWRGYDVPVNLNVEVRSA